MHLEKFDLNLLVALDALLTERHVTRAADKVCVSQPAMSAALARLRHYFNDPLLERSGAKLDLTPRAAELAGEVRELLLKIKATLRTQAFDPAQDDREFRLVMSDYVASILMPVLTKCALRQAPNIKIQIEPLATDSLAKMERGLVDCCITVRDHELQEGADSAEVFSCNPLFSDHFVLVVDEDSPAALRPLSADGLLELPYVAVRFTPSILSAAETSIRQQRLPLRPAVVTPSFTAAASLIRGTNMTTFIPRRLADLLGPAMGLAMRDAPIPLQQLDETLVWHKRSEADPAHSWIRSMICQAAQMLIDRDTAARGTPRLSSLARDVCVAA